MGLDIQPMWSDDGIVVRLPAVDDFAEGAASAQSTRRGRLLIDPEEIEDWWLAHWAARRCLPATSARTRRGHCCCQAARRPAHTLWQMRQRSAQLLAVASRYASFPIVLETYRECLQDVFDLPALKGILGGLRPREIALVSVETVAHRHSPAP
jgi:ATP-dependent Lhr-like helicase